MTGFARVRKATDSFEIVVSVKSVNHRGLDVHFRMPPDLDAFENAMRAEIKRRVLRGHLQVQVNYTSTRVEAPAVLNVGLLDAYMTAFRRAAAVHGLHGEPDLNAALRLPGMFQSEEEEPDPALEAALVAATGEALDVLNEFREREGGEIAAEMRVRAAGVLEAAGRIEELRGRAAPEFQARLNAKIGELLEGVGVEPQRIAQEVAFLVDRSDISEEVTRLKLHTAQLMELLEKGGEIGKKLDFLLQEMNREANTLLSKSTGAGGSGLEITNIALGVKAEIEKIREQGLNLE
jgi:uncharacterized protein (TIGR00255 family)